MLAPLKPNVPPDRRPGETRAHLSATCFSPGVGEHAAGADGALGRSSGAATFCGKEKWE